MIKIKDKKEMAVRIKNFIFVIFGTLVLAFGTAVFILPNDLVIGGVSGIAIILDMIIPFEFFTVDLAITILTWGLFFLGLVILGKSFALKTLLSTLVYPIAVSLFLRLNDADVLNGFFNIQESSYPELALILSAVFGGAFVGVGCAITFLGGGSTGGVDVIAFIICKIFKRAKSSVVIFLTDSITVILGVFVIGDLVLALLGIVAVFVSAVMIDKVLLGGKGAFVAEIISEQYSEISKAVIEVLDRTTTVIDVTGGYSGSSKKMLKVSFTIREYAELINIINKYDKTAFITIHRAHEINGEGWTREKI